MDPRLTETKRQIWLGQWPQDIRQGLKPIDFIGLIGTTEVVPCYKASAGGVVPQPVEPLWERDEADRRMAKGRSAIALRPFVLRSWSNSDYWVFLSLSDLLSLAGGFDVG
jgi:hypothetical protein